MIVSISGITTYINENKNSTQKKNDKSISKREKTYKRSRDKMQK